MSEQTAQQKQDETQQELLDAAKTAAYSAITEARRAVRAVYLQSITFGTVEQSLRLSNMVGNLDRFAEQLLDHSLKTDRS